jgi:hypothetical protein
MIILSQDKSTVLAEKKLYNSDNYQIQEDTMLVWRDLETFDDFALSFQTEQGRDQIAREIQIHDADIVVMNTLVSSGLPDPTLENVEDLTAFVTSVLFADTRSMLASHILKEVRRLLHLLLLLLALVCVGIYIYICVCVCMCVCVVSM